ncbi:Fis family transcriptional regulator [Halomonas sp. H5]|uniref:Fis family transcriptional regulator n=1 Tax=Halomonas sp. H5 TaxID=3423910 RepID=UPI003D360CE8
MRKSDKQLDNRLRGALMEACELALESVPGFRWLTHLADYQRFPDSLRIVCVFDSDDALARAREAREDDYLCQLLQAKLAAAAIKPAALRRQVRFDSEEACQREHKGNWKRRLHDA